MSLGRFKKSPTSTALNASGINAEINVTPMVDVMLVLLVIFIMAAPLMHHGIRLELPQTQANEPVAPTPPSIAIFIDANNQIFWEQTRVELKALQAKAKQIASTSNDIPEVVLQVDKQAKYDTLAQVMSHFQKAGLSKISFAMDKSPNEPHQDK